MEHLPFRLTHSETHCQGFPQQMHTPQSPMKSCQCLQHRRLPARLQKPAGDTRVTSESKLIQVGLASEARVKLVLKIENPKEHRA